MVRRRKRSADVRCVEPRADPAAPLARRLLAPFPFPPALVLRTEENRTEHEPAPTQPHTRAEGSSSSRSPDKASRTRGFDGAASRERARREEPSQEGAS